MQSEIGDGGNEVALLVNHLPKVPGKEIRIGIQGIKQLPLLVHPTYRKGNGWLWNT